jgi:hypothetical protein
MAQNYEVTQDGSVFARLGFGGWKTVGDISLEGKHYQVVKPSILGSVLELQFGGERLCETSIHGILNRSAELGFEGVPYALTWRPMSENAIFTRAGTEVGSINQTHILKRIVEAEFADDLPSALCAFVLWLVVYKRNNDATAATVIATT